jgi:hypothetical protein
VACSGSKASPSARTRTAAPGEAADWLKSRTRTCAAVKGEAEKNLGQAFRICDDFDSNPHRAIILLARRCADSRAADRKA